MFLAPLIRWLASEHDPRLALTVGVALVVSAVAIGAAGIAIHQPMVTRIGILLMLAGIATLVIRNRRERSDLGHRGPDLG